MLRIMLRTKSSHMMPVLALCVYCHFCTQRVPAGTEHGYLLPFLYAVSTNRDTGHSAHCPCLTHTSAHILSCSRVDLVQLITGRGLTLYWTRWHFILWTWSKYFGLQVSQGHTRWTRSTAYNYTSAKFTLHLGQKPCGPGPRDVSVTHRQVFAKLKRHDAASEVSVVGDGVV